MTPTSSAQREANDALWQRTDLVRRYETRNLRPPETSLLLRYHDALAWRVLEIGAGAGRITGYLGEMSPRVTALDVSSHMLEALKRRYPDVATVQGDIRDLSGLDNDSFDAIVAGFNIPDVLDDEERNHFLDELLRLLAPGGLVILSTHNRGAADHITDPMKPQLHLRKPGALVASLRNAIRWRRNRRRLRPHEVQEGHYAILNDLAHDYGALHYYIDRDAQVRQLEQHGFEFLECLDLEGRPVGPGEAAADSAELHYAARRPAATGSVAS